MKIDIREHNRRAWDKGVEQGDQWTVPVSSELIAAARNGDWNIVLTPHKPVPRDWFADLKGLDVLCLASGGGQQAPILAAAGANVTSFDNSPKQLERDRQVAERDSLSLITVEGDMANLSVFASESFDLIFHPCSNMFVPDVRPVWREAYRVLRTNGLLLAGFTNPVLYLFDQELVERGSFSVRHKLPFSDLTSLSEEEREKRLAADEPLEFGHTLEDQIGGQLDAGFVLTGFYEDGWQSHELSKFISIFIATRALKLN